MREIDGRHARYEEYAERWKRCRDTLSGSEAVKAAGEAYLPRLPGQDQAGYDAYRMRAVFYGAAGKTLKLYTGLAFSKAPVVSGVAADDPVMVDADMAGKPFSEVLEDALAQVIGMGRYGIPRGLLGRDQSGDDEGGRGETEIAPLPRDLWGARQSRSGTWDDGMGTPYWTGWSCTKPSRRRMAARESSSGNSCWTRVGTR